MKKVLIAVFTIFTISFSVSQDIASFKRDYENGKELFNMNRYGLAMQAFQPLTSSFNENPFIKEATFYYGVSAYYENQIETALSTFNRIKVYYPSWDQLDQVNLWLGKSYLKKSDINSAIKAFNELKNQENNDYASKILLAELEKIDSYDSIESLYQQYPDNKSIGITMAGAITKQPLLDQNRDLLYKLIKEYDLDEGSFKVVDVAESKKKSSYTVAIMLPFMINELQNNRGNVRNQFVIDLYQGVLLGVNLLKTLGIKVDVLVYDTENNTSKVRQILSKPELQHVDLIYGPLYPGPVKMTNEFSFKYKINMFNPLSSNSQIIGNNPYSFLYKPTYETQGKQVAEYIIKNVDKKDKIGFVFYGREQRDSLMAKSFMQTMYEAGDSTFNSMSVPENQSKRIIQFLTESTEVEEMEDEENRDFEMPELLKIGRDSIAFIYVASEQPAYAASTITALETRGDTTVLLGKESWLNSQIISYDALERLNALIFAPTYLDKNSSPYKFFESMYKETYNSLPSLNACLGYETIILLGKLMNKYGNHFQNEFDDKTMEGYLFGDYVLQRNNDNQNIPIVKFKGAELVRYQTKK